ncbi:MAG TPA: APC family permease [Nitrospira sp.]|jgi:amino acid transporter|nr:APC family permease [Nitrospira sp.]MCC7470670.1 APC family permease [Candidatus Nomurabacteria bacterium]MBS0164101.1 APC family permease [Nitrospira sp.]MBS0176295.1 APC family permease [Nitrospira sp.]MBX3337023.1 APC family permease [Nitrospira sp.]
MILKRWLVGLPLKTKEAAHERLSKRLALAVFSSDALSSVAYATEEILLVLTLAGTAMVGYSIPLSLSIIGLLIILTMSYRQIIFEYPEGGGAYIVGKSNLGEWSGLVAAAALMIDYVLTVAVSVAAGIAALTSAVPDLLPHREGLCVAAILLVTVVNLRGVRESGQFFAVPTYIFIGTLAAMLGVGAIQILLGVVSRIEPLPTIAAAEPLTLFLLLRAFSSGCTALTGVEVISNGVSAFKKPEPKNAALTMIGMAVILGTLFIGISGMAYYFGIVPKEDETVVSQIARATFGTGPLYYLVQASTMIILILAANSSFNGFPRLASILARDSYMPHQMSMMGDRLVFSNGVIILGVFSCLLIILFNGDTHALIPLYAVGVFLSFTISQAGMVKRWLVKKGPHWEKKLLVNGIGAVTTAIATVIIASTKFTHGAWIVIVLIPLLISFFRAIHSHYKAVAEQVALSRGHRPPMPRRNIVVLPIGGVNRAVIRAVDYARSRSGDIRAVLVDVDPEETARVEIQWAQWGCGVPLTVLPSPYRSVLSSLLDYLEQVLQKDQECWVTVVIPEILPARWWQNILHNQRAFMLKGALLFKDRVILTDVPYHLTR